VDDAFAWMDDEPARARSPRPRGPSEVETLRARVRELEELLRDRPAWPTPTAAEPRGEDAGPPTATMPSRPAGATERTLGGGYFARHWFARWGPPALRRTEPVDAFGLDPSFERRLAPLVGFALDRYFRVETRGAERLPAESRAVLVANHSTGPIPFDGLVLRAALGRHRPDARPARWLCEDDIYHLPFVGTWLARLGGVRACPENAERLLAAGTPLVVFPEGMKGIGKLYRDRYRLQRFGRGGFVRLCIRTGAVLVPCAVVGGEEANPLLYRLDMLGRALGLPYLPITATFPLLGPLGFVPAPSKWIIRFAEPLRFDGYAPEAAGDDILVGRLADRVRGTIQGLLDDTLARRRSVWMG
jgi:1-acyl-sn-glycerol-3-phosphate acyltransferase